MNVEEADGFLGETVEELITRNASEGLINLMFSGYRSLKHLISKTKASLFAST